MSTRTSFVEIRLNPILTFLEFETCCIVFIRSASKYSGEYFKYLQFKSTAHEFKSFFINNEKSINLPNYFLPSNQLIITFYLSIHSNIPNIALKNNDI